MSAELERVKEEENRLRNLHIWSWYIKGARDMLHLLRQRNLCDEPKPKGWKKDKENPIYNKAILDLIMESKTNVDRFLSNDYDDIRITDHEKDKKGKLIKCRAYFARRVVRYAEL